MTSLLVGARPLPRGPHAGRDCDQARELLREVVAACCGVAPREVRTVSRCAECGSSTHGRPYVLPVPGWDPPHVSLSRADGLVLVAVTAAGPVGVDVERAAGADFPGFDEVALHPSERATEAAGRTRTWVRKESLLKALGRGLAVDPREVRLSGPDQPAAVLAWPDVGGGTPWLYDLDAPPGYVAAATVLAPTRPRLRLWHRAAGGTPR